MPIGAIALRYEKKAQTNQDEPGQYQLFDTPDYSYRVFVTNLDGPIDALVWFLQSAGPARKI